MSVELTVENNIAAITFDAEDAKVNILTFEVLKKFDALLDQVAADPKAEALIVRSGKKDCFIAGADIKEIEGITDSDEGEQKAALGQSIFNKLEDLKVPTVAVIDGVALGGGCELALACQYRVATFNEKVRIGLPEVNLGILPGFGGTYRLPRVVGLSQGLTLILTAKPIDGNKALKVGLVDRLFPQAGLSTFVHQFVADVIDGRFQKKKYGRQKAKGLTSWLESNRLGHLVIFRESRKNVLKASKGFYPAPLKALEVIRRNFYLDRTTGLKEEAKGFGELVVTDVSKNLISVFYLSEKYRKLPVPGGEDVRPREINKCGVVGAGVMGGGIAQLLSSRDIWTRMKDIHWDAVAQGYKAASKVYQKAVEKRKFTGSQAAVKMGHISGSLDYSGFKDADIVIEAVVEDIEIKKKVFEELGGTVKEDTVLATNTSALPVTEMAKATKNPSRVIGLHFFNPVHRMPLVEIITTPMTSSETIATTLGLAKRLGKTPILVKDSCGFVVNRILLAYISEAGRLLQECGKMEAIDGAMTRFGMPMGPFTLADEVGLDVGIKVMRILEEKFGPRYEPVGVFKLFYDKKHLGKKSGTGFYIHGKRRTPNPQVREWLSTNTLNDLEPADITRRLVLTMVHEAARCLEDGVVEEPSAIDAGMIFGTGFPPFRGGLLRYADSLGTGYVHDQLEHYALRLKADYFKPCAYIKDLKGRGENFYGKGTA